MKKEVFSLMVCAALATPVTRVGAQGTMTMPMPGMSMPGMPAMNMDGPLGVPMDRMGSGTTWIPDAVHLTSVMRSAGGWMLMFHGMGFLEYDHQGSTRGDDQLGSINWAMLMADHDLAGGRFEFRAMTSLEPITVGKSGYPLLLQSGEMMNGVPLHDRQHPHDAFMELAALYERALTRRLGIALYAAPAGEPALGPVAFMHRPSGIEDLFAPIGHHWQDATHISFGVATAGLFTHNVKVEGSVFNGREPDDERWNFDMRTLDSYSGRLTVNPSARWSFSAGYGYLASPEALEPTVSLHRATASALYGKRVWTNGLLATSVIVGGNKRSDGSGWTRSALGEANLEMDLRNTVFARAEVVEKTSGDLVITGPERKFTVSEATLGYMRELARFGSGTLGLGVAGTVNVVPRELRGDYGNRAPVGATVFMRVRVKRTRTL